MRLIDADELEKKLPNDLPYKASVKRVLIQAPTVEAEPVRHGKWEECDWVKYDGHDECVHYPKEALRCSNCCNAFKKELLWKNNYCPNCGAKMGVQ